LIVYNILGLFVVIILSVCWLVVHYKQHPNYSGIGATGYPNDVGVLFFSAVSTNTNVRVITMATSADGNFAGTSCVISGWGRTAAGCEY
jgi:hypothetical protein